MPWPMIHFAVANEIYEGQVSSAFLLGSIAPDAIHAREGATRREKMQSHFVRDDRLADPVLLTSKYLKYIDLSEDPAWKAYIAGYFIHIFTDERWTATLYADFERKVQKDAVKIRKIYNEEVSQLEYHLLRSSYRIDNILTQFETAKGFEVAPFVSAEEVETYRDMKLEWLRNPKNEPGIELIYFTEERVHDFIKKTADEAKELLKAWEALEKRTIQG
ncbi:hypothetical protein QPK24_06490 [Paenibacillus polygoni]|uniref:Zinc dependent phospholipase C n=1 Tax=Paenibacillus polygoni TaxID=3050112 RepID=A0ABY8X786_9BACL|nr:hypothetical protein [Paenibacillus polygoni]WIV20337.1 hypothetical protein QPK24_06490 [Paenibacillus polygoni]